MWGLAVKRLFALMLMLALASGGMAELNIGRQEAPATPEQQWLFDLSSIQANQVISNMLATQGFDLEPGHTAGRFADTMYNFIIDAESGLPEPTSVVMLLPNERFGKHCAFSEQGISDPAVLSGYGLSLALSTNYNANLERDQAIFLESMSAISAVEAWAGNGVAFVLRLYGSYGDDLPQFVTAISLQEDDSTAIEKNHNGLLPADRKQTRRVFRRMHALVRRRGV